MATYDDAYELKKQISAIVEETLESNEDFKRCIKARKAIVTTVPSDSTDNKVGVKFIADDTELFFPYNNKFAMADFKVGMAVSVWYSYSINNGIVTEDGTWTKSSNLSSYLTEDSLTTTLANYTTTEGGTSSSFSYVLSSSNFKLLAQGTEVFVCNSSGVTISGTIYANDGTIGGLTIAENSISSSNGNFSITGDGVLYAISGTIGDLTIGEDSLSYAGKMYISGTNGKIATYKNTYTTKSSYSSLDYSGFFNYYRATDNSSYPYYLAKLTGYDGLYIARYTAASTFSYFYFNFTESGQIACSGDINIMPSSDGTTTIGGSNSSTVIGGTLTCTYELIAKSTVTANGNIMPSYDDTWALGSADCMWQSVYVADKALNGSDRKLKKDIEPLADEYTALFDSLKPSRYKLKKGKSDSYHTGFIAQEVEEAIAAAGLQNSDFAAYDYDEKSDTRCLAYNEFIALCVKEIQNLKKEVNELKNSLKNN